MTPWLPEAFAYPVQVALATGHHMRPISGDDIDLDYPAVMGSQERLWTIFGEAWRWPPVTMTREADYTDLVRHAREMVERRSFNYAIFDPEEQALLGCIYIDPPAKAGADAEICWWVVDAEVGGALDRHLDAFVAGWIADAWPFRAPRLIGVHLSWADYLMLPDA